MISICISRGFLTFHVLFLYFGDLEATCLLLFVCFSYLREWEVSCLLLCS